MQVEHLRTSKAQKWQEELDRHRQAFDAVQAEKVRQSMQCKALGLDGYTFQQLAWEAERRESVARGDEVDEEEEFEADEYEPLEEDEGDEVELEELEAG